MNTQLLSTIGCQLDRNVEPCRRAVVNTGPLCNYKCEFCYFKNDLKSCLPLEDVKRKVDSLYNYGFRQFDLTGGEPSIRKDFFDILDYCKKYGEVSCLSNGYKFADLQFCKDAQQHGLNEVLFSVHGSNSQQHDAIVGHQGAFERILQAIKNCKSLGYRVRINCTVTEKNANTLASEYPDLINPLDVFEVNFIVVNYFSDNKDFPGQSLELITNAIKCCIDKLSCKLINVRYVPYCYMQGYEKHVTGYYQLVYDVYDWNLTSYRHHDNMPVSTDMHRDQYNDAKRMRCDGFHKTEACKECKYFYICDGIKNGMPAQPKVVQGIRLTDVNHFRHGFFD